jgi:hypothetical protein
MCENCTEPPDPEMVEAHDRLEAAINNLVEVMGRAPANSVMVDWVVVSARSIMGEHGSSTVVGWEARIDQQHYRTKGMLHEVLDDLMAQDVAHRLTQH